MQRLYRLSSSNCADHFQFEGVASKLRRRHRTRDSLFTGVPHITKSFLKVTLAQRAYGSHVHSRAECTSDQSSIFFPPSNLHSSSRSPSKRISELVPLEQTKQPAIKIMSRSVQDRIRAQSQSRTGSVNGEDAEPETRLNVDELALISLSFSFDFFSKSRKIRDRASL